MIAGSDNAGRVTKYRLIDALDFLVDVRVGIVRSLREVFPEPGGPDFFSFVAQGANGKDRNWLGAGASRIREAAICKAVGECVERYCLAFPENHEFVLSKKKDANFACADPGQFALYSRDQYAARGFPFVPFNDSTLVAWHAGYDVASGEPRYVPASMVFLRRSLEPGESLITQGISTGAACRYSFREAACGAIHEVIERDAFTIFWQAKISPPHVDLTTLSPTNRSQVQALERGGCRLHLLDITTDVGVPTFSAALEGIHPRQPALLFSAATHLDPEEAVRKCLEEMALGSNWARHFGIRDGNPTLPRWSRDDEIREQHVRFYFSKSNALAAGFCLENSTCRDFRSIPLPASDDSNQYFDEVCKRVFATGHDIILHDITSPDITQMGLVVVRAVIPGFHPLFMGHENRALGGRRLYTVPQKLGYQALSSTRSDNALPHPLP